MSSHYPEGWDEQKVLEVLKHYEEQNELEAVAEDEASFELDDYTYIEVPKRLLPQIRELIKIESHRYFLS